MRPEFGDRLRGRRKKPSVVCANAPRPRVIPKERTPFCIIAILSARRAVDRRCVIKITLLILSPVGAHETRATVSKTRFCACASSDDVCHEAC